MMRLLAPLWLLIAASSAAPGFDHGFASLLHGGPGPIFPAPVIPAPILPAPTVIKAFSPPVIPGPVFAHPPVFAHAPVFAPAPVFKTVAPVPIIKQVAPATSYATVTQFITHPSAVVKTVVAPQPILKSFAVAAPLPLHGYPALPSYHH